MTGRVHLVAYLVVSGLSNDRIAVRHRVVTCEDECGRPTRTTSLVIAGDSSSELNSMVVAA